MRADDREAIRENFLGIEDGHIYFFYYPKSIEAHSIDQIENLSFILHPFDSKKFRLILLEASSLPQTVEHFNMVNGIVKKVDDKTSVIHHELESRHQMVHGVPQVKKAQARPCGEGVYTIIKYNSKAYLVYVIELPRIDGKVKEALNIGSDGVFSFGIYNPYSETATQTSNPDSLPHFPERLKANIKNQHILYDNIPELLNYEKARVVIFKEASLDIKSLKPRLHPLADTQSTADIFGDLKLQRETYPVEPLFRGEWR